MERGSFLRTFFGALTVLGLTCLTGCGDGGSSNGGATTFRTVSGDEKPRVAFVPNMPASFWDIAKVGAYQAGKDFNAEVDVRVPSPTGGVEDQKRIVEDLLSRGIDGIAISPRDPANQGPLIDRAAEYTRVITQDSDAPDTKRLAYVGMDNYKAGRMCGELVKEALPDGGSVIIFVGLVEQDNARGRRQGVIDELLDRPYDPTNWDPPGQELSNGKYTILDTRTDGGDFGQAKSNAEDAISRYADLDCMVGLFAYNPPLIYEAVRTAGKLDQIKIIGFDEDETTLRGIVEGGIYGTVVQDPYNYGYESVRILAALARGDTSVLPEGGFLDIPARQIRKDNVQTFWDDMKRKLAGNAGE